MKTKSNPVIPSPTAEDSEDVCWALSTAGALWTRGELHDALKWLGRAVEAAADEHDDRVLELWRASAEIASAVEERESSPPPARPSPTPPPLPTHRAAPRTLPPPPRRPSAVLPPVTPPPPRPSETSGIRVAVRMASGTAELVPLATGAALPKGAAAAMLVPMSKHDADMLSAWSVRAAPRAPGSSARCLNASSSWQRV